MDAPIVAAPASAPTQIEVEVKLPKKEKKPRTDAQKAATEKALNVLRERREAKEEAAVSEAKEIARVQVSHHKRKNPGKELATKEDLESLRGELASVRSLLGKPAAAAPAPAAPAPTPAPAPAAPKPAPKMATPVPSRPTSAERLTGRALLDSLFPPGAR